MPEFSWALIGPDNIVTAVQIASEEWVEEWRANNPDSTIQYVKTDPHDIGYAGLGYTYILEYDKFRPIEPPIEDAYFDYEQWRWRWPGDDEGVAPTPKS